MPEPPSGSRARKPPLPSPAQTTPQAAVLRHGCAHGGREGGAKGFLALVLTAASSKNAKQWRRNPPPPPPPRHRLDFHQTWVKPSMGEFPFLLTNLSASEKEGGEKKVLKKTQLGSEVLRSTISGAGAQGWGAVQAELMGGTQPAVGWNWVGSTVTSNPSHSMLPFSAQPARQRHNQHANSAQTSLRSRRLQRRYADQKKPKAQQQSADLASQDSIPRANQARGRAGCSTAGFG